MRNVMLHEAHARLYWAELPMKRIRAGLLMPHADKMPRRVENVQVRNGPLASGKQLQGVAIFISRRWPAETNVIQLIRANPCKIQARTNGIRGKSRVVFQPADPLFSNGKKQFAVAHHARRRVMQL